MRRSKRLAVKSNKPESTIISEVMEKCTTGDPTTTEVTTTTIASKMITGNTTNCQRKSNSLKSVSSNQSYRSGNSIASQRRLLEAQAIRRKAEIERQAIDIEHKRIEVEKQKLEAEKAVIDARLQEDLINLENSNASSSKSIRTREWIENVTTMEHETENAIQRVNPRIEQHMSRRPQEDAGLTNLTHAITEAFKNANTTNATGTSDKLLGRLSARDLPSFSGDPLDWLRFRNAFKMTTRVGQYTEEENISRLQRCLHGEAWEAVSARLLTTTSATDVMTTLEMRFGRPDLILAKLITDMKRVPKLSGARSELVILATKVENCVAAIESTGHTGYLYSPDLTENIISKLTEPIFYRWLDYSRDLTTHQPQLPLLAKYLIKEAEEICRRGAVEPPTTKFAKFSTPFKHPVMTINSEEKTTPEKFFTNNFKEQRRPATCIFCDDTDHQISNCEKFKQQDINQRWEWICTRRLCFKCLRTTHRRDRCKSKIRCSTCKGSHHKLLHRDDWTNFETKRTNTETTATLWSMGNKKVFLKVLPVTIEGPKGGYATYALLDEGSTVTLVESSIAKEVGAIGPDVEMTVQGAVGNCSNSKSQIVSLTIKTEEGSFELERVRTINNLTLPEHSIDEKIITRCVHLKDLPIRTFKGHPSILIGQDYWHLIISRKIREGKSNEPVASFTKLGWVLHGFSTSISRKVMPEFACHLRSEEDDELHLLKENYFRLDSLGIRNSDQPRYSPEERRALHILDTKSRKINCRWESALLWRNDNVQLPNNKRNAECRLRVIEKMMDADSNFATDYSKQVDSLLANDYAKKAIQSPIGRVWYLPHFGVRNPNKPGKLRLVFDAKAETKGISLNTELLTGPDLLNSLLGVLLKFRERKIAVTADIKEMFLQVKMNEQDQNAQCFLWRGMERKKPPEIYKMTSMTFGATSSPCTATYIIRRNADDFAESHPRAVEAIKNRHYVDDYLDSVDDEEEMKQLVNDVIMIHKEGGFNIRGWASNIPDVLPLHERSDTISLLQQQPDKIQRTLGLNWKTTSDTLGFDLSLKKVDRNIADGLRRPTKREMLKIVMSVFDPLGMLCPFLINGKIILQEVWRMGVKWDDQITEETHLVWIQWIQTLQKCKLFSIPRWYGFSQMNDFSLHVFVDASEQAYAAVAYLVRAGEVAFVAGKSRVTPLKSVTIPKLELQAAIMGARLGHTIEKEQELRIEKRFFWTDSQTVYRWINKQPRRQNAFISNRLMEIDELTQTHEWRWLSGKLNVADEATRSNSTFDFTKSKWVVGPDFLRLPEAAWPKFEIQPIIEEDLTDDVHQEFILALESFTPLVNYTRFSNWRRLLRCVSYILLFIDRCSNISTYLTPAHDRRAENFILKEVQAEIFPEELAAVRAGKSIKPQSRLKGLNPYLDESGLLCVKSRLFSGADLPQRLKAPIILDAKHYVVRLIIEYQHRHLGHHGTATLINELRQSYYILRLRNEVKSLLARCIICRARRARCEQPMMAGLPQFRLQHHCRPFSYCGIDLFGPMNVSIGRRHEKRWGVIFTCFSTRAVHLELVASLSMDSTVMAIRRMAAQRGWPIQIHSDNGTNFRSADKELKNAIRDLLNDKKLQNEVTDLGIKWTFNPPEAPHMGGVWERLVRSVKTALSAILFTRSPKEEVLLTLLKEAENIVNSRPITAVSLDPNEEEALTPNHFLVGSSNGLPQIGIFSDNDLMLRKQWRISQRLADHFWTRWLREYLPTLQDRRKWPSDSGANLEVGDLVLISDGGVPRNTWPRGRVSAVLEGSDGRVRMVDVLTRGGTLRRPATKLILLTKKLTESAPT